MSAVEALAEVLREHLGGACSICDDDQASHLAADLAAAIRSWPAEQVAELIGGTVDEEFGWDEATGVSGHHARAVGPWTPSPAVLGLRKIEPEREQQ